MATMRRLSAGLLAALFTLPAHAVSVYLDNYPADPNGGNELTDPSHVEVPNGTWATLPNKGSADLGTGTFRSYSDGTLTTGVASAVYVGISPYDQLVLTNNTGSPVTIAAGDLRVHVVGAFSVTPTPNGVGQVGLTTGFVVTVCDFGGCNTGGQAYTYDSVIWGYDAQGNLRPSVTTSSPSVAEVGIGHTTITHAGFDGIVSDMTMDAITLDAGATLYVSYGLNPSSSGKISVADFYSGGAQLSLQLPAGVTLDSNASVPLTWITSIPVPASAALFGSALALLWLRRRGA